ncbi:MAG: hypothetical protein JST47_09380 [Bacteroidetes bacterium]|nr:hypothetical protein [Bacteroidota bacterium]
MANINMQSNSKISDSCRNSIKTTSIPFFLKSLLSVIVMGKSPADSIGYYRIKKTNK